MNEKGDQAVEQPHASSRVLPAEDQPPQDRACIAAMALTLLFALLLFMLISGVIGRYGAFAGVALPVAGLVLCLILGVLVGRLSAQARRRVNLAEKGSSALPDELTALTRIAGLATTSAPPAEVFGATAEALGRLASVETARVMRYETDGEVTVVAAWGSAGPLNVGDRVRLDGDSVTRRVYETGKPARLDGYIGLGGAMAQRVRSGGIRRSVGWPIFLGDQLWGVMSVGSLRDVPIPLEVEDRVGNFTALVALVVSNAQDRDELIASRARIVSAVDETRRRLERDLHDGLQQRLVSLALDVRRVQSLVPEELDDVRAGLLALGRDVAGVVEELREVARGIHPAILTTGGLVPALKSLARRSALPVVLEAEIEATLPERVEVAAYYLVSEALTNATKHAHAHEVSVRAATSDDDLTIAVSDDGVGGANREGGSGMVGMEDRVSTLGGRITVTSDPGSGTTLEITLPIV